MPTTERLSVSLSKKSADEVRALVAQGAFPSVSAAIDAASAMLIERHHAEVQWWRETAQRCREAAEDPGRVLSGTAFHDQLWATIHAAKAKQGSAT